MSLLKIFDYPRRRFRTQKRKARERRTSVVRSDFTFASAFKKPPLVVPTGTDQKAFLCVWFHRKNDSQTNFFFFFYQARELPENDARRGDTRGLWLTAERGAGLSLEVLLPSASDIHTCEHCFWIIYPKTKERRGCSSFLGSLRAFATYGSKKFDLQRCPCSQCIPASCVNLPGNFSVVINRYKAKRRAQ